MSLSEIMEKALRVFKPTPREEEKVREVAENVIKVTERFSEDLEGVLDVTLEGSAAKNTWIRGREEVDVFVHFEPGIPRDKMEEEIIRLGFKVIEELKGKPRLMYADHPYVEGRVDKVRVNLVACYETAPPNWLSATDRTPYHTKYVREKLEPGQEDQVRLLKAFALGCGVYGAEIRVGGLSGYITELLILAYRDFENALKNISAWSPPITIDIERHYSSRREILEAFPNQRLIIIDPVDKSRNAAAAVSAQKLGELILSTKLFLRKPAFRFFKSPVKRITLKKLEKKVENRFFLVIESKLRREKPPDVLWGELHRTMKGIRKTLQNLGVKVYRSGCWTDEESVFTIIYELDRAELPAARLHVGPPAYHQNAVKFIEKWRKSRETVAGPWVEGERIYVLRRVKDIDIPSVLRREIRRGQVGVAKGLKPEIERASMTTNIKLILRKASRNKKLSSYLSEFLAGRPRFLN